MEAPPHSLSYNESTTTSAAEAKEEAEAFISQNSDSADQTEATMTSMETPRDHPLVRNLSRNPHWGRVLIILSRSALVDDWHVSKRTQGNKTPGDRHAAS